MIITEFMEKGSLASLLNHEPDLSYRKRLHIATGISSGMSRIHDLVIFKIFSLLTYVHILTIMTLK